MEDLLDVLATVGATEEEVRSWCRDLGVVHDFDKRLLAGGLKYLTLVREEFRPQAYTLLGFSPELKRMYKVVLLSGWLDFPAARGYGFTVRDDFGGFDVGGSYVSMVEEGTLNSVSALNQPAAMHCDFPIGPPCKGFDPPVFRSKVAVPRVNVPLRVVDLAVPVLQEVPSVTSVESGVVYQEAVADKVRELLNKAVPLVESSMVSGVDGPVGVKECEGVKHGSDGDLVAAFPEGCYLKFFRRKLQALVYGELGPAPELVEVLGRPASWFDADERLRARVCVVVDGKLHVSDGGEGYPFPLLVAALGMSWKFPGLLDGFFVDAPGRKVELPKGLSPGVKVGAGPVSRKAKLTLLKGGGGKASCSGCGKVVWPDKHKECPSVVSGGAPSASETLRTRLAFVGTAAHAMDVKVMVAAFVRDDTAMSARATDLSSLAALRDYLFSIEPGALPSGRADRAWAFEFTARYCGAFRRNYLRWLAAKFTSQGPVVAGEVVPVAGAYSSLLVQVMKDVGA